MENSCLMLMMSLYSPVSLGCVISEEDLAQEGIEEDSHITTFYANGYIPKDNILSDAKEFLGALEYESFMEFLKSDKTFDVYDSLGLDKFENPEYDVLILRLKPDTKIYSLLDTLNKGYTEKYGIKSDYGSYKPHLTLSYLQPGAADKYLSDEVLGKVLDDSKISYDDLVISYKTKDSDSFKQWYLTHYWCVQRKLRMEKLKKYE